MSSGPTADAPGLACVYKPVRGERPLDDFPDGTLADREVAAYHLSEAIGWSIVPPTVMRDGPFGRGMVQAWLEPDPAIDPVDLIRGGAAALRRMALFDAVANNADRKVGHLLPMRDGHVYGVDHGICFAVEPKLRTVLWNWRGDRFTARRTAGPGQPGDGARRRPGPAARGAARARGGGGHPGARRRPAPLGPLPAAGSRSAGRAMAAVLRDESRPRRTTGGGEPGRRRGLSTSCNASGGPTQGQTRVTTTRRSG